MNGLTAGLQAAQQGPSPVWGLEITAAPRSTGWLRGGTAWQRVEAFPAGLAAWNGQSIAHDAAGANAGGVLRVFLSWLQGTLVAQYCSGDAGSSSTWTAPSLVTVAIFGAGAGIYTPKPALLYENGRWHCFYRLADGNIYLRTSSTNGATWSGATTVYGGGDATGDLFAAWLAASNIHLLHFATLTDTTRLRGASRLGHAGAWSIWPLHGSSAGWQPAGIVDGGGLSVRLLAAARPTSPPQHRLGSLACTLTAAGGLATRAAEAETLWLVEGSGAIAPWYHAAGAGLGGWLHSCHEEGRARRYLCAGAVSGGGARLEEPAPLEAVEVADLPLERQVIPVQRAGETLLVGLGLLFRTQERTQSVSAGGDEVIAYGFGARRAGPGLLTLAAVRGSALAAVEPGWGLWLRRSCTQGSESGSVTLGLRVVRVERRAELVRLVAADALGLLEQTAARRPLAFDGSCFTRAQAVEALAAWAGVPVLWETTIAGAAPAFQWRGGETALSALGRLLLGQSVCLRSRVSAAGEAPALVIAAGPALAQYAYGGADHPIVERVVVEDGQAPRLAVAHGLSVRYDPANGEEWALRLAGAASPLLRPAPAYLLNRNLGSADLLPVAQARAAALGRALPAGWLEARPNLALEPNDWITVEGEDFDVRGVAERWERRRFTQRVELARRG